LTVLISDDVVLSDIISVGKDDERMWTASSAGFAIKFQDISVTALAAVATFRVVACLTARWQGSAALIDIQTGMIVCVYFVAWITTTGEAVAEVVTDMDASSIVNITFVGVADTMQWFLTQVTTVIVPIADFAQVYAVPIVTLEVSLVTTF
jgi:hypothetical protein